MNVALRYAKFGVALLIPIAIALNTALNGGDVTQKEVEDVVAAVLGAVAVFAVPNQPAPSPAASPATSPPR